MVRAVGGSCRRLKEESIKLAQVSKLQPNYTFRFLLFCPLLSAFCFKPSALSLLFSAFRFPPIAFCLLLISLSAFSF